MKHLSDVLFWPLLVGILGVSVYLSHVEKMECMKRGGAWIVRGGCEADSCSGGSR